LEDKEKNEGKRKERFLGERIFGQYGVYDGTYDTKDYNGGKVYNGYDGRDGYGNHTDGNKMSWEIRVVEIYDEKGTDSTKTKGSGTRGVSMDYIGSLWGLCTGN